MSIIKAVQDWLGQYPGMKLKPLTDTTSGASSYAIAPAGNGATAKDITGARQYHNNFVFYAEEAVTDESDRTENYDFLDGFTDWIEGRADAGVFPILPGAYEVESIEVSNILLMDVAQNGHGTYQVQIQITSTKRRDL